MEDLISRRAVLDGLASIAKVKARSDAQKSLMGRTMFFVEQLPSVENKGEDRPKGAWIRHTRVEPVYSIDGVKTWGMKCQCNQCTFTTIAVEDFGYYDICPNCGADMRGEE